MFGIFKVGTSLTGMMLTHLIHLIPREICLILLIGLLQWVTKTVTIAPSVGSEWEVPYVGHQSYGVKLANATRYHVLFEIKENVFFQGCICLHYFYIYFRYVEICLYVSMYQYVYSSIQWKAGTCEDFWAVCVWTEPVHCCTTCLTQM